MLWNALKIFQKKKHLISPIYPKNFKFIMKVYSAQEKIDNFKK